jgi:hypothetical protein
MRTYAIISEREVDSMKTLINSVLAAAMGLAIVAAPATASAAPYGGPNGAYGYHGGPAYHGGYAFHGGYAPRPYYGWHGGGYYGRPVYAGYRPAYRPVYYNGWYGYSPFGYTGYYWNGGWYHHRRFSGGVYVYF